MRNDSRCHLQISKRIEIAANLFFLLSLPRLAGAPVCFVEAGVG